jgi:hypothetical protein
MFSQHRRLKLQLSPKRLETPLKRRLPPLHPNHHPNQFKHLRQWLCPTLFQDLPALRYGALLALLCVLRVSTSLLLLQDVTRSRACWKPL